MAKRENIYKIYATLLLCLLQVAGIDLYAQQEVIQVDSVGIYTDSISNITNAAEENLEVDSLLFERIVADSITVVNEQNTGWLTGDSVTILRADSIAPVAIPATQAWTPNPAKATWLAVIFPGGGQIYNRKYWKLPIIYGGFAGCAYALNWNNNMYKDYAQAYLDIMDKDPTTNSYVDLIRTATPIDENTDTQYGPRLKRQKDYYRRYRDISVFAFIGVYLLSILDAYVDAELSNFDITPDISMRLEPAVINSDYKYKE